MVSSNSKFIKNFIYLFFTRGLNMIFPFVTMIYLQYKISLVELGIVAFVFTTIDILVSINDFGVHLNFIKAVSKDNKNTNLYLSELVKARLLLMLILMPLLFLFLNSTNAIEFTFITTIGIVFYFIGLLFYPIWFYQSIQNVKTISLINIFFKCITMLSILFIITDQDTFKLYYIFIIGISFFLPSLFSWIDIFYTHHFKYLHISFNHTIKVLRDAFSIFVSSFADFLLVNSPFYIIKLVFPGVEANLYLGIYSSCDKYIRSLSYLSIPLSQSIYPRMLELKIIGTKELIRFTKKVASITIPVLSFICILIGLLFYLLLEYGVLNTNFQMLSPYFYILLIFPIIYTIQGSFVYQLILVFDQQNYYARLIVLLLFGSFVLMSFASYYFQLWGLILSFLFIYFLMILFMTTRLIKSINK